MNLKRVKRMVPIQAGERTAYEDETSILYCPMCGRKLV